ncbi:MAG: N-6 DNA methylase [Clostridia bacterium]|nr:N-6 DNA methylase [Clostridia bacterium]
MLGAIIGDITGSRFEWHNIRKKEFELLSNLSFYTDDTVMTLAIAKAILDSNKNVDNLRVLSIKYMQQYGRKHPNAGYGARFNQWLYSDDPKPYGSWGNGAAMRVSACGLAASSLEEAIILARTVTEVTHNHLEGIKGAEAIAVAIYMAKTGCSIIDIQDYIQRNYYNIDFRLDDIRNTYKFNESCQETVPQALEAFFESTDFEDAIRNAVSIGGDSDTIAAITGSVAEAYYGIPSAMSKQAITYLTKDLIDILVDFENKYSLTRENSEPVEYTPVSREEAVQYTMELFDNEPEDKEEMVTGSKLKSHLYKCCDILRGPVLRGLYKSYVIPIVFFKRISDVYDEEYKEIYKKYDGIPELISRHKFSFAIPRGCHWNDLRKQTKDVGTYFNNCMMALEQANPDSLGGVFSGFDEAQWTNLEIIDDNRMKNLVEHISKMKMGNKNYSADVMGDTYEYLLKEFATIEKQNGGQFYTPRTIVKLMVQILNPQKGDTIYDPACGTGGMLIEAIRQMKAGNYAYGKIFGQEKVFSTSSIARMNLYLHGAREFTIAHGDTLRNPAFSYDDSMRKFDHVLANPPFGLSKWGSDRWEHDKYGRNIWGTPSNSNADWAWIQHIVSSMNQEKGKAAFIMSEGVLFHDHKEKTMREKLVKSDKVEYIIALPVGVFFGANVSAYIIVLNNRKKESHKNNILFIDASSEYTPYRALKVMEETNIKNVYNLIAGYHNVIDKCALADLKTIASHNFDLVPNKYIKKTKAEIIQPELIKQEYIESVKNTLKCEQDLINLLKKGGYIDE